MDISNLCTIAVNDSSQTFSGKLDNISANGFVFLATDEFFAHSIGKQVTVTIVDFPLANHNVLEGRIIRSSDNSGLYIVGCQMPEDNLTIMKYVENNID